MIKLQITRYEKNENYEAELAEYKQNRNGVYSGRGINEDNHYPLKELSKDIMDVFITEEQFETLRRAALEVF